MAENLPEPGIPLHGDLELKIIKARSLPNLDIASEHLRRCFNFFDAYKTSSSSGDGETERHRKMIASDPYVTVCIPGVTFARTRVISNSLDPEWNENFNITLAHRVINLEFRIEDKDVFGSNLIGTVLFSAQKIISGEQISGWFPVFGLSGTPPNRDTALLLDMKFIPCENNPVYRHGIAGDPKHRGVKQAYFPLRKGGSVTLYQDAHVPDEMLPAIKLDGGKDFKHHKCWEDICHAIDEAHHLIYIVGWSVYHKVKLVREPTRPLPRGGNLTLGELLKFKSQEGVRVLLLVWDDRTSLSSLLLNTAGVMQTHDEETRKFFKHSSVICVISPRHTSSKMNYIKRQVHGTVFTHHQKCVLVDTPAAGNNRKITAFMGGLDLCDGRYDTPGHRLFCDLDTVFCDDYRNPTFPVGTRAPRQPWHDMHCKIEGPAAYDVLINFEQRWGRATKWTESVECFNRITHWHDDALIRIERISWILSPPGLSVSKDGAIESVPEDSRMLWVHRENDPENWHVQVFRSIDSKSVKGFPKTGDAAEKNLFYEKKLVIDKSIQTGYIQAIRSAQHFIYIENQYFLGSSYAWPSYKDAGADNLIPMELALKIVSKIRAKERFAVYIIIPMWPEGDPTSAAMQEILFWQGQTIQGMYKIVGHELKSTQLPDSHPLDYLNFYCLGNREKLPAEMSSNVGQSSGNVDKVLNAQKFQRFMIYVHSKGMIVDDEYIILGSANINERSLAGTKDTEIAMGAYQPHYTWAEKKKHPCGQIYGYRMSLWAEHLGMVDEIFKEPESLECVKRVNKMAGDNWRRYTDANFTLLQGHLLKYPIYVDANGIVSPLPAHENFPDVGGKVLGADSFILPDSLTT